MSSLEKLDGDFADVSVEIREVWDSNLEEEFSLIRSIVDEYPFISMDTEFPGVPLRPVGIFRSAAEFHYCTLKSNVNHLNLIQLGLTFSNSSGRLPLFGCPPRPCIWQFNFREFDAASDVSAPESIELLRQSGMDFEKNRRLGVAAPRFAELIMSSGAVLNDSVNDSVHWIAFHCCYDFGYLLKMLTSRDLPDTQEEFFNYLRLYFPNIYDIKHLMRFSNNLYGGLNKLAELLEVERVGVCHQAGSDSLLTAATFKKLKDCFFNGSAERYAGVLYDLGVD